MTIDLAEVETVLRQRMKRSRYFRHADFEDAIQEGMIRAWRDLDDGMDEFRYVVNRAAFWARRYFFQKNNAPTGMEKRARFSVRPEGVELHLVAWDSDYSEDSWIPVVEGFEESLMSELSFWELISGLRPDYQDALYQRYYEDKMVKDIGRGKVHFAEIALKRKLGILPPVKRGNGCTGGKYKPRTHCNAGHEFKEGTFRMIRTSRRCTICEKEKRKERYDRDRT